jgi:hypothetical protein
MNIIKDGISNYKLKHFFLNLAEISSISFQIEEKLVLISEIDHILNTGIW